MHRNERVPIVSVFGDLRNSGFVLRHESLSEAVEFGSQVGRLEDFDDWREASEFSDGCVGPRERDLHVQPAIDTPEVRALTPLASHWIDDHEFVTGPALTAAIDEAGAVLIGYRELRDSMRAG